MIHKSFQAEAQKPPGTKVAFVYSGSYVMAYQPPADENLPNYGPTRLLVVKNGDNAETRFTYTGKGTFSAQAPDREIEKLHGEDHPGKIVWSGPKEQVIYSGPSDLYEPAKKPLPAEPARPVIAL